MVVCGWDTAAVPHPRTTTSAPCLELLPSAGDHKGPHPLHTSPAPTKTASLVCLFPTLLFPPPEVDAYEGRSIGRGRGKPAPTGVRIIL